MIQNIQKRKKANIGGLQTVEPIYRASSVPEEPGKAWYGDFHILS